MSDIFEIHINKYKVIIAINTTHLSKIKNAKTMILDLIICFNDNIFFTTTGLWLCEPYNGVEVRGYGVVFY